MEENEMKKKVLIVISVVVLVLSVSIGVLADTDETKERKNGKALGTEKQEQAERNGERIIGLFEEYYPEGLEELIENREAHVEFHEGAKEAREELAAEIKEAKDEIKEDLDNGEITRIEARRMLVQFRYDVENMKTDFMEVLEQKKTAQEPFRERLNEIREELKVLLTTEPVDAVAVKGLLEENLGLFKQHLENDIYYFDMIGTIAESYGF
jgi:hypothetical protein